MTPEERRVALEREPLELVGVRSGLVRGTATSIRDIWAYRELLLLLTKRELKVRYKDSVFGFLWSLLRPLSLLLVYYVAIGKFLGADRAIPSFAVYVFTGLAGWQAFNEIIAGGAGSILSNSGLIKKIYLPREVFPLSVVGSALFNLAVQIGILIAAGLALGEPLQGGNLGYLPLALGVIVVWGTAIGLLAAAVNVYLRDTQYIIEIGLMVMFWTTPTVYSWELVQNAVSSTVIHNLYLANPVTTAILAMQRVFWAAGADTPVPNHLPERLGVMLVVGVAVLWGAQRVFSRLEGNFAQEL